MKHFKVEIKIVFFFTVYESCIQVIVSMKCILKYFRIHLFIFICTHEQANIIKTQPTCFLLFSNFLWSGGYVQGDVFKHTWIQELQDFFIQIPHCVCTTRMKVLSQQKPTAFYSFLVLIQPPRAESIFWREPHYVCLSLIFPRCNIWSKTQSMQFSTPSFQDIIMPNKCCHVKVCDSHILGIAGKAFESFQF